MATTTTLREFLGFLYFYSTGLQGEILESRWAVGITSGRPWNDQGYSNSIASGYSRKLDSFESKRVRSIILSIRVIRP
jgi:hypothetical protein